MNLKENTDQMALDVIKEKLYTEALAEGVDLQTITQGLENKTYIIPPSLKVPLHEHPTQDEIFYCIKGEGIGIVDKQEITMTKSDVFIAPAGSMHSIRSSKTMVVLAFLVPVKRIICHCNNVTYVDIRKAMLQGARTLEEIKTRTGAASSCGKCSKDIEKIISMACGCKMVSVEDVVIAVKNGADTVEKIGDLTGAGTECGNCKLLLQNIIDLKK